MGPPGNLLGIHDLHQAFWLHKCVVSLLGNSIQFFLKYKTVEDCCLCCTTCIHQLFFWEGRNELTLEDTCFWKLSEQLCYVGYEWGRTLPQTVPLYGRDGQYLHLLANGRQKSGLPLHQLLCLKTVANLFLQCLYATDDVWWLNFA